jgi:hypothetical protein
MTRERPAACPFTGDELVLLQLNRHVPERSVLELRAAATRVGDPVRLALFHLQQCEACDDGELCLRGERLVGACRGWRPRPELSAR